MPIEKKPEGGKDDPKMDIIREELLREIEDNVRNNEDCKVLYVLLSTNKDGTIHLDVCAGDETNAKYAFSDAYLQLMMYLGQAAKVCPSSIRATRNQDGVYYAHAAVRPDGTFEQ
ncbi:MAG: hypothetical protein IKE01_01830 [Clostridia bacterium]|nr:hypothetical protein [Clostridia bacterium]